MIPGGIRPNRQPDGNSVILEAPEGLVVVDTGRHAWHREAILSLARAKKKDIVAIVNTHWHLDHVSGNPDLRAAHPGLRVHSSAAIDGALTGFLPASAADSAAYLDDPKIPEETREDIRADLLTIQNGGALKPDVVIAASGTTALGGLALRISFVPDAVTAGDVWLYDPTRRVAVLGDLVTLPAPFFDTACPQGWKAALDAVASTPFEVAIPGHGAPMTRAQFLLYQSAFESFIECSGSTSARGRVRGALGGLDPVAAGRRSAGARASTGYGRLLRRPVAGQWWAQQALRRRDPAHESLSVLPFHAHQSSSSGFGRGVRAA
jgi:glyoxylase-like metal-dependent hydrolase (beta-lactamase superfamily II)